jgi:archaeosine synthase beta-subunit
MNDTQPVIDDKWILSSRGSKKNVDPQKPYAFLVEKELTASGKIEDVAIIFLTNRECPFRCLMCDLWKNTTDKSVPPGAIANQIEWASNNVAVAKHLKLYNCGSFFDGRAINFKEYERISSIVKGFETIIVESHPAMINDKCLTFRDMLKPDLQVAIGLETVDPEVLKKLNKKMSLEDFTGSVSFLTKHHIKSRAFVLLRPPFQTESEGIFWAKRSIDFAFNAGVECCTVIPVRGGNGAMDILKNEGLFSPPGIRSLEEVLEYGISLNSGRVFADVWDLQIFSKCDKCLKPRTERIIAMNLSQKALPQINCSCTP